MIKHLLDYRGAAIYNNINPLDIPSVRIRLNTSGSNNSEPVIVPPTEQIAIRVTKALGTMLKHEYGDSYDGLRSDEDADKLLTARNPRLSGIKPTNAVKALKTELKDFQSKHDPFNRPLRAGETALDWWVAVQKDPYARVLGVSAFP